MMSTPPPGSVSELFETFHHLQQAAADFRQAALGDIDYPSYIPTFGEQEAERYSDEAKQQALTALTRLQFEPTGSQVQAGLICASDSTLDAAQRLNRIKNEFKAAVRALRPDNTSPAITSKRVARLLQDEAERHSGRPDPLRAAMAGTDLARLDLKRCYAEVKIMPPGLVQFSWTWSTNHHRMLKLNFKELQELVEAMPDYHPAKPAARLQLGHCRIDEEFVRKLPLANQVRANYTFEIDGVVERGSTPLSGPVLVPGQTLPKKLWRPDPATQDQPSSRTKRPSAIEDDPFILALAVYRYRS